MTTKVREELYQFTQLEPGVEAQQAEPDASARPTFTELYRYQVPVGMKYTFRPGHTFSFDSTLDPTDLVRVEVRSQNQMGSVFLIESAMEDQVDEFTDIDLIKRFDISEPVVAEAGMWIVIGVIDAAAVDPDDCHFILTCDRQRIGII